MGAAKEGGNGAEQRGNSMAAEYESLAQSGFSPENQGFFGNLLPHLLLFWERNAIINPSGPEV
jgi:hypothetical protein